MRIELASGGGGGGGGVFVRNLQYACLFDVALEGGSVELLRAQSYAAYRTLLNGSVTDFNALLVDAAATWQSEKEIECKSIASEEERPFSLVKKVATILFH